MPTRIDWLPYGILERLTVMRLAGSQIDKYSVQLGLTPGQVDRLQAIPVEYEFAVNLAQQSRATNKAVRGWRDAVISNIWSNKLAPERPMFNNSPAPVGTKLGLVAEFRELVRIIKASTGFREPIGFALSIMPPQHEPKDLREIAPTLAVTANEGFTIKVNASLLGMDAIRIEIQRKGSNQWELLAVLTHLPATLRVVPTVAGAPEAIGVRGILLKKNNPVGGPSPTANTVIFAT